MYIIYKHDIYITKTNKVAKCDNLCIFNKTGPITAKCNSAFITRDFSAMYLVVKVTLQAHIHV